MQKFGGVLLPSHTDISRNSGCCKGIRMRSLQPAGATWQLDVALTSSRPELCKCKVLLFFSVAPALVCGGRSYC